MMRKKCAGGTLFSGKYIHVLAQTSNRSFHVAKQLICLGCLNIHNVLEQGNTHCLLSL